jgi:hypothetical protein
MEAAKSSIANIGFLLLAAATLNACGAGLNMSQKTQLGSALVVVCAADQPCPKK